MLWPQGITRPIPRETPKEIAQDFKEACGVYTISLRASAALARRCLQNLLRKEEEVHEKDLYQEIEKVLDSSSLPPTFKKSLHLIRNLGIIAAHPLRDVETNEIIDIERNDVELVIDVLGQLRDYYYETLLRLEKTIKKTEAKVAKQKKPPKKL